MELDPDSKWAPIIWDQALAKRVKHTSYSFGTDSFSVVIATDRLGNRMFVQRQSLDFRAVLFGPPLLPIFPTFNNYGSADSANYYIWCELQSRGSMIQVDASSIQFFGINKEKITPIKVLFWRKQHVARYFDWIPDSSKTATMFSNDTIAISFNFMLPQQYLKQLLIDFHDFSNEVPPLLLTGNSEWIYYPLVAPVH